MHCLLFDALKHRNLPGLINLRNMGFCSIGVGGGYHFKLDGCDDEQVFDGHGGTDAACFIRNNILKYIVEDSNFPMCLEEAIKSAFLKADYAFADSSSLDISSGTTALTTLIFGG